ncbi:MAG: hypothetical protein JRF06_03185 [Deltaproteobacteria bacterium]|nr:hypothetical protein [Deltaproteobacteria bacterium]
MAIGTELTYAKLDELYVDPMNPRLGRNNTGRDVSQETVLDLMRDWKLDELAVSFLESGGFWTHEAILVTKEKLYGKNRLVVIEGNRRIAALKYLYDAINVQEATRKWKEIAESQVAPEGLFEKIPYIEVGSRDEIEAFLGFRHVTGIKEWKPAEKAEFIAKMIDNRGMSYEQVMRKIGSKTSTVRRHYIAYRLLLQIENMSEEEVQKRFSVMYLSLRTQGVQQYLQIDIYSDPETAKTPVPKKRIANLSNFALWLFGDSEKERLPLFTDSRQVDNFGRILESNEAVEYLERTEKPSFEIALRISGGDEPEIIKLVETAADNIEMALTRAHFFKKSKKLKEAVERLAKDTAQIMNIFPSVAEELDKDEK